MAITGSDTKDYRAAIEAELRERLLRDRARGEPERAAVPAAGAASAGAARGTVSVSLLCAQCQGISAGDASFCTQCGTKFNVRVIAPVSADAVGQEENA